MIIEKAHFTRWEAAVNQTELPARRHMLAPLFLLTGMPHAWPRLHNYVRPGFIEFDKIALNEPLSAGEKQIVCLAANLYNGSESCSLFNIFSCCDDKMQKIAVLGIEWAYKTQSPNWSPENPF